MGSRHPRPGPHFRLPGPHTSRLGACHPRPLASSFQDRPPTQWSYDAVPLTSPGTAPAPTRLGSARPTNQQPAPAAAPSKSSPNGLLRHPLPEKANGYKVLVGPYAAGSRSSIPNSAEFLSSPSCTRASTSPMTPPSRPTNATAETRFSLVALHAKDTHIKSHSRPQDRPRHPGAAGSVHPTRRSGGGGPCSCMRLPHCSPLGISWGPTPQSSPQSTSLSR